MVDVSESEKINLDAKTISKSVDSVVSAEDPIWLVGAPIDKVPTESLFTGTFFQTESNLELMEYMLSAQGNNTVRTDVPTFIEYINSSGSKTSPRAIFESLAMPDSRHLFETMKKE